MAKKHKRRIKRRRGLPRIFSCPRCGKDTIKPRVESGLGYIRCPVCGLEMSFPVPKYAKPIDVYNMAVDAYFKSG